MMKMDVNRVLEEYTYISSKFTPKYIDVFTFTLIKYVQQKIIKRLLKEIVFETEKDYKRELDGEISRLLVDCYILGRIEIGNQRSTQYYTKNSNNDSSFYKNNKEIVDEMSLWVESILEEKIFTKIPQEIRKTILTFNKDTGDKLVNYIEYTKKNTTKLSELLFWVSLVGREIALVERLSYDPKLRSTIEPIAKKISDKQHQEWLQGLFKVIKNRKSIKYKKS